MFEIPSFFRRLPVWAGLFGLAATALVHAAERPNIILIMGDDMGFSDLGCYGGEIGTPHLDALAGDGLRFTQFYNTARCCPTRASLMSGLYPHQAGVGHMMDDRGYEGYLGEINRHCMTIAEVLRDSGYATFMTGKWHLTELEKQPGHLIDIMATCVDVADAKYPAEFKGRKITPLEGRSLKPAFEGKPIEREALYWEHEGNRAVRVGDMKLVAKGAKGPWELYDVAKDRAEQHDLAREQPAVVRNLAAKWQAYAERAHVLPLNPTPPKAAAARKNPAPDPMAPVEDNPKLPRVLLLGDSISIGYTVPVRALLKGKANVHRPPANCGPTTNGLKNLDAWLGDGKWDVIHFNWGLHDLKYVGPKGDGIVAPESKDSRQQVPIDQYEANLKALVERLKRTGAKLVWCATTPVPEGAKGRLPGDEVKYNQAAARVMTEAEIPTNDLHAFALPRLAKIQIKADVHYTPRGSRELAKAVADAILAQLDDSAGEP